MAGSRGARSQSRCRMPVSWVRCWAMLSPDAMRQELKAMSAATSRPYNVNFFTQVYPEKTPSAKTCWRSVLAPYYRELGIDLSAIEPLPSRAPFNSDYADVLEKFRPAVVAFISDYAAELLAKVNHSVESVVDCNDGRRSVVARGARRGRSRGAGLEAGGHRGMFFIAGSDHASSGRLRSCHRSHAPVRIPVIAAGGIADARESGGDRAGRRRG